MKKIFAVIFLFAAVCSTGCDKKEPVVLDQDERKELGELMAKEAEMAAAQEEENPE